MAFIYFLVFGHFDHVPLCGVYQYAARHPRNHNPSRYFKLDKRLTFLNPFYNYMRARAFNHLINNHSILMPRRAWLGFYIFCLIIDSFPQSFFVKQVVNNKKNGIANKNSKTDMKTTHFLPEQWKNLLVHSIANKKIQKLIRKSLIFYQKCPIDHFHRPSEKPTLDPKTYSFQKAAISSKINRE